MTNHSTRDQVNFCVNWFNSWSELQRDDFVTILSQKIKEEGERGNSPEKLINGLVNGIQHLGTRPPSLFACQVKLFNEWWGTWTEEDKERFNTSLKNADSKFWNEFEAELKGERKKDEEFFFTVTVPNSVSTPAGSNHNHVTVSSSSNNTVEVAEEAKEIILNEDVGNKTTITVSADNEAIITTTNTSSVQLSSQSVSDDNNDNANTSGGSEVTVIES